MPGQRRIASFLALAFTLTWGVAGVGALLGIDATSGARYMVLAGAAMFGPAIAALIQQMWIDRAGWKGLGLSLQGTHWGVVAATALLGVLIVPLCLVLFHLLGDVLGLSGFGSVSVTSDRMLASTQRMLEASGRSDIGDGQLQLLKKVPAGLVLVGAQLSAVLAAVTVNLPFMMGEELGWRGYLWQRTRTWKAPARIGLTGVAWGLWHAPLIAMGHNYPGHPIAGIGMMVLFCLVLAILFDHTRTRSGSVWSSCLLHGIINGSAGGMALFAMDGHVLVGSPAGLGGVMALGLLALVVVLLDRRYRAHLLGGPAPIDPSSVGA